MTATVSYGILLYSFTVFIEPMHRELGWSTAALTGAFSLAQLVSGVAAIPIGRHVDEHGARGVMTGGAMLVVLMLVWWSQVQSLWSFYVLWFALGVAMSAVLYEPAFVVVAVWFRAHRARALTVLTFLGGFASIVFVPLSAYWVVHFGWRTALLLLAAVMLAVPVLLHAIVLRHRPADVGALVDGLPAATVAVSASAPHAALDGTSASDALRTPSFRWFAMAFSVSSLMSTALSVHLVPLLLDRDFTMATAAAAMGVVGLAALPGRLIFTPLGERWSRTMVTASIFVLQAIGIGALLTWDGMPGLWIFSITFGAGFGAITPARAALIAQRFGARHYGRISGVLAFVLSIARAAAPIGASLFVVAIGPGAGYEALLVLFAGLSIVSAAGVMLADRAG